jgi:PEGA domain
MKGNKLVFAVLFAAALLLPAVPAQAHGFHGGHGHGVVVVGGGWGWGGWGWGYGYPYYGYPYYGYPAAYGYGGPPVFARVKTDVDPEEAWLYLDGRLIGTADDFDGYPDYLYLKRGHYRLEFRLDGYETKTVEIDARPGMTAKIDSKMAKTPGAKHHGTYESPNIPGGILRFWGKRGDADVPVNPEQESQPNSGYPPNSGYERPGDDRYSISPPARDGNGEPAPPPPSDDWRGNSPPRNTGAPSAPPVRRTDKSHLTFSVTPGDAAVYVDDRFVGTAEEVGSLPGGLLLAPGKHTVTASRPGFRDQSVEVEIESGGSQRVEISLRQ